MPFAIMLAFWRMTRSNELVILRTVTRRDAELNPDSAPL
jgi:hypothetical protein